MSEGSGFEGKTKSIFMDIKVISYDFSFDVIYGQNIGDNELILDFIIKNKKWFQ